MCNITFESMDIICVKSDTVNHWCDNRSRVLFYVLNEFTYLMIRNLVIGE